MPIFLLIVGSLMVVAAVNDKQSDLFNLVKGDFEGTGQAHGFLGWFAAIIAIGAIGYIETLKPISRGFLALVIVVLILKKWWSIYQFRKGYHITAASFEYYTSTDFY